VATPVALPEVPMDPIALGATLVALGIVAPLVVCLVIPALVIAGLARVADAA
jgi:hypothetical protein